ncbi:MAG: mechanosensitive ion channel family protein, partial [Gammaproteobacteria bacterium]|nr:mechanosensitive ion channel family protein [Gammaproteobacteria bacterium]
LVAKIAEWLLVAVVGRLTSRTKKIIDDRIISLLRRPVFNTLAIFGLMVATTRLGEALGEQAEVVTIAILKSIIILSWVIFLVRASGLTLAGMERQPNRYNFAQKDTVPLLRNLAVVFLLLAGTYAIMLAWDIDVTGLLASAGIVGLALSFAAQDTLSHLFAGVAILADRPYRIGDMIVLDTGERGEVTFIGLRSTRLLTRDDVEIVIPNGVMGSAKITNETGGERSPYRIRATVGAAYGSDVEQVLKVLEDIAHDHPDLLKDPAPRARFRVFGSSSLDFELLAWVENPALRGLRVHELNVSIYKRFMEEGIAIPFPQQDVYIKELPRQDT